MAVAAYRHLVIDANAVAPMGAFWASTLGLVPEDRDGEVLLRGATAQHSVWIDQVPEPLTVKQRVHLDVHAGSVEEVLARGATPADLTSFRWKVVRDPEGGELCVFERAEVPGHRLYEVCVDSRDAVRIATWWADLLGGQVHHDRDWSWVDGVAGLPFESLVFNAVPEPKTVKNRIHWDVTTPDVRQLVEAGATVLRVPDDEIRWTVLADPEGNELCAFEE